jgi:hypothetical protein
VTGLILTALSILGCLCMTAVGDMVSEEVRDRLDHLPHAILRLAARRLPPAQRVTVYEDECMPELTYILKGDEARPVTRGGLAGSVLAAGMRGRRRGGDTAANGGRGGQADARDVDSTVSHG